MLICTSHKNYICGKSLRYHAGGIYLLLYQVHQIDWMKQCIPTSAQWYNTTNIDLWFKETDGGKSIIW